MKKRNTLKEKTERVRRERDPIPWRYCLLTLVCGLILGAGFFWAARQHFSAMDLGIRNARLREQRKGLEDDQRRLYITKETSLSPAEIKKMAKKIGLQELTAQSIEMLWPAKETEKSTPQKTLTPPPPQQAFLSKTKDEKADKSKQIEDLKADEKVKENKTVKEKSQTLTATTSRPQIAKK